ncbi:MAG: SEL1-like repeat protein [Gammaproteobacteria bacterium]|nr:SEL1-like repeat protein [Gammaproteobacteria bacterium]
MLLVISSALALSGFDKGTSAYKRGDYETALSVFRPLAENGDPKAQSILGMMYNYGEGVAVDYRQSARWYRLAAEQNYGVAQYNLGMAYLDGKGVSADTDKAIEWLTKAADSGHFRARSELAKLDGGSYASLTSPPSDSLEMPPTMTVTEPEPRSVVMRKQAPARKSAPPATGSAAVATTASVAAASAPARTKQQPTPDTKAATHNTQNNHASAPPSAINGTRVYRVQLAASRSEDNIRRDWSSYQQRHSDIFAGLDGSVERAEVGEEKTVWYRLRVGPFASEASARELCSKLAERNIKTGCLPLRASR